MALHRGIDGPESTRPDSEGRIVHEEIRIGRSPIVAIGTLACPACDAPVALAGVRLSPTDPVDCPFCDHHAPTREFLTLGTPARPARVAVRVITDRLRA